VELLRRERDGAVAVRGVLQDGERRVQLRQRRDLHALGRRGVQHDAGGAVAPVEQQLGEDAPGRVADDDRRRRERLDDAFLVLDDRRDRQVQDRRRVGVERLDVDLEPGEPGASTVTTITPSPE
jgi:hypothetical protein